jgi:Druantia protein DruA
MPMERNYRGRVITPQDIAFLRRLIAEHSDLSRRKLSTKVCEAWEWRQANGALRDMVCRGLLLMLHRAGAIELPPVRFVARNPFVERERPAPVLIDTTPLIARLDELRPLEVQQVRRTGDEPLFNSLIEHHHYLGYQQPVGEHLKYLVWSQGRPIACMAWSSAPRHLGSRDRFIGWSKEARKRNIRFLAYNARFLILPWVQAPHLASHILSRVTATLSSHWERMYGHPIWFVETFIDPQRFRGTCYRAANWVLLGRTTGRGKDDLTHQQNRSIKEVLGLPLTRRFRELLSR